MGLPAAGSLGVTGLKDLRWGLFTLIRLSVGRLWSPLAGVWTVVLPSLLAALSSILMELPAAGRLGGACLKDLRRGLFTLICMSDGRLWSPLAGVWTVVLPSLLAALSSILMELPAAGRLGGAGLKDLRRGLFTLICLSVGRLLSPRAGVWKVRPAVFPYRAGLHP